MDSNIVAPIHLLQRRDGPLDHGRGGFWGMNNNTTSCTPLETFALFQELNRNFQSGLVISTFNNISDTLKKTPVIYEQDGYDASRLSPDSLQGIALQILRDEKRREAEVITEKNSAALSPNSKKRKLQSPPVSTSPEALEHAERLPILVEKLYVRFRDSLVREIREDERRFEQLQRELAEIERGEWDDRFGQEQRVESSRNGVSGVNDIVPARPEGQLAVALPSVPPSTPASVPTPTPTPTPAPIPTPIPTSTPVPTLPKVHDSGRRVEPSRTPQPPQERKTIHPIPSSLPSTARPSSETRHVTPDNRSQELGRPIGGPTPVLQHPQAVQGYTARPGSTTPQPPVTDGLQRPEGIPKGRSPAPIQSSQPHTPAPAPTPTSAPAPISTTAPSLKWEPPYQPPHPLPQPSYQISHQPPQPPSTIPSQHQPPHQTPVPSPRPPYSTGVTRPPTYPSQAPTALPQFPQNYSGGRETPGQYGQQSRPPVQGSTPASPSVLLPPQNAGQMPPSLQSLPLNAAPDGAGQQAPQWRPESVPTTTSPVPNVASGPYPQPRSQHMPTQTPVRPPVALSTTHPAVGSAKPPVPPAQWAQSPGPVQPNYPQNPTPTTPAPQQNQPQPASRSYSSPYNQQAQLASTTEPPQRPQVPPLQTSAAVSQSIRPVSMTQLQTPVALSPHVVRGHGTKWTSTPTPATPRMEDGTGYFDFDSPIFEPISPPPQPVQLPKTSPENSGKKDTRKVVQKLDGSANRPRGRPRISQKPTPLVQSEEAPAEPDLSGSNIKNEEATPRALEDIGDVVAVDENVQSQVQPEPNQPSNKRKRQDSPLNRAPPTPATHVLWTRSFNKISQSALDQIISHRHANMFAHPVKPRTAPGYFEIVLRPQDLKGIQKAITAGSKAAAAAVATMSNIEANATSVWIPMSVDLVPPRGIINIAQLERELVHMFANAIMYNPDPYRGFGPSFLRSNRRASLEDDEEDYRGYEVDENGVVKDTRSMFGEVEKLLSDLRNEVERNAPPPTGVPPSVSRSLSVAGGEANVAEDDADEQAGDANKRRRIRG
ncbi:hypothetical protein F4781DRAFT_432569 [Annulohypoxylon bovei var. microspora]|nr:hypothetical protein F4781DRAFT_432569 [Annulohypoxylon bovei var. microspora]